jgi:hypothetical protein
VYLPACLYFVWFVVFDLQLFAGHPPDISTLPLCFVCQTRHLKDRRGIVLTFLKIEK